MSTFYVHVFNNKKEERAAVCFQGHKVVESVDSAVNCTNTIRFYNRGVVVRELVVDYRVPMVKRRQLTTKVDLLVKRATGKRLTEWLAEFDARTIRECQGDGT